MVYSEVHVQMQDLFNDEDLFSLPSTVTAPHSVPQQSQAPEYSSSSRLSTGSNTPQLPRPANNSHTLTGRATQDSHTSSTETMETGEATKNGVSGPCAPGKVSPAYRTSHLKGVANSPAKPSTAQKLNSFRFVKSSNSRKRYSIDDNESCPKRKSSGDATDANISLSERREEPSHGDVSPREAPVSSSECAVERNLSHPVTHGYATPSSVTTPTISGKLQADFTTPTSSLTAPSKSPSSKFQTGFTTPTSHFTTPNQSGPASKLQTRSTSSLTAPTKSGQLQAGLATPTSGFTTPTKPPAHRNSIASIVRTIQQSSSSSTPLSRQAVSFDSSQQPVLGNTTPSRRSAPENCTPLRRQSLPGNSTPLCGQSAPGNSTPLCGQSAPGNSTPLCGQSTSVDPRGAGFSTPLNRRSAPPGDGYSTPQPTPLICTPGSGAGSAVDIVRTPVPLAKRKFPGPAGLLPPLVCVRVCACAYI